MLSLCQWDIKNKPQITLEKSYDEKWINKQCKRWLKYFKLLEYNTFIIQYEQICLEPELTLSKVLNFCEYKSLRDIKEVVKFFNKEGDISNTQRYKNHCLKWQKNDYYRENFVPIIWENLQEIMPTYGYTKDGHNVSKFMI